MEINPLKTMRGCPCSKVIKNQSHMQSSHPEECMQYNYLYRWPPEWAAQDRYNNNNNAHSLRVTKSETPQKQDKNNSWPGWRQLHTVSAAEAGGSSRRTGWLGRWRSPADLGLLQHQHQQKACQYINKWILSNCPWWLEGHGFKSHQSCGNVQPGSYPKPGVLWAQCEGWSHTAQLHPLHGCVFEGVALITWPKLRVPQFPGLLNNRTITPASVVCGPVKLSQTVWTSTASSDMLIHCCVINKTVSASSSGRQNKTGRKIPTTSNSTDPSLQEHKHHWHPTLFTAMYTQKYLDIKHNLASTPHSQRCN